MQVATRSDRYGKQYLKRRPISKVHEWKLPLGHDGSVGVLAKHSQAMKLYQQRRVRASGVAKRVLVHPQIVDSELHSALKHLD